MPRKPAEQTVNRQDILLAAAEVFQERGYQGATMADIARKVNLTAGSLYHHFPAGKQDLLLEVLNTGLDMVLQDIQRILHAPTPPAERLRQMVYTHVTNLTKHVSVGAAMVFEIQSLLELTGDPHGREDFLRRRDTFEHAFRSVVEEGIALGQFRTVDIPIFVQTMLGAQNWVSVWYNPNGRLRGDQIADQIADTFLQALRP